MIVERVADTLIMARGGEGGSTQSILAGPGEGRRRASLVRQACRWGVHPTGQWSSVWQPSRVICCILVAHYTPYNIYVMIGWYWYFLRITCWDTKRLDLKPSTLKTKVELLKVEPFCCWGLMFGFRILIELFQSLSTLGTCVHPGKRFVISSVVYVVRSSKEIVRLQVKDYNPFKYLWNIFKICI